MATQTDPFWQNLFKNIGGESPGGTIGSGVKKGGFSFGKGIKKVGPSLLGWILLEKYLSGRHESKMQNIQMEAAEAQANTMTPENMYYQAALPKAKEEEEMARNALLTQMSGGIIGPSLARGERMSGG